MPPWVEQLTDAAEGIAAEQMSRFLPPEDGGGRASAVLMVFGEPERGRPCC